MDTITWVRLSQALAERAFYVDILTDTRRGLPAVPSRLRAVPFSKVNWSDYDVVITFYHEGYQTLMREAEGNAPPVISMLGSVVGRSDETPGVYFFGEWRQHLYEVQRQIHDKSRRIVILTEASGNLWKNEFGSCSNVLLIPSGVDARIPSPRENPFAGFNEKVAVYIGHVYQQEQKEVNLEWQRRLNKLGGLLRRRNIRLCFLGSGDTEKLDEEAVTHLGRVPNEEMWDYQYFADVGIVLAQGRIQHNESSKIYYYLRTGLPVVSETPVSNNYLIRDAGVGLIADYGDDEMMVNLIEDAAYREWDREKAIRYILDNHTWDHRAALYEQAILGLRQ
jgi:glycosyltransferase involved in cell wall biosynthesis